MLEKLAAIVGAQHVLTGSDVARYGHDFTQTYQWTPLAVCRPANTGEVAALVRLANETKTPVVPVSGNTGLAGGARAEGAIMISLERMNAIREIRPNAHVAIVEAGVVLSTLREAATEHELIFPLTFGAQGSAMIGGNLATNAGGSNVLRYGNTRDLVLGIEAVLPTGEVMDIMSELHKDNSGYNLKHLLIGAEGTLGIITAAVLKLVPKPRAYATAMVAVPALDQALTLLNRLQEATGGGVEAFEYMPRSYIEQHMKTITGAREPFDAPHEVNILVEVGATAPRDATLGPDGVAPITEYFETILGELFEEGALLDAVVAQNEAQRREMWERREAAAEVTLSRQPIQNNDIAVPLDKVAVFLERADTMLEQVDAGSTAMVVSHLGDGNVHYAVWPQSQDPERMDAIMEAIEEIALDLGGSFSAEHGIGTSKLPSMTRRKNKVALGAMRAIKAALDPNDIMNPGKVLPADG
ncbi:FAD-binding oxidoreductase [Alisedimentitalea sp. MJ-SS2]|uniref:FAD-binding oxidoreductase n=1 Tax=Aliisedimentitalea sp. MJ-SS2 TaxID=3049795 RepID=UPI002913D993|nr:FAD-binding oxidoreductase [Alisedimentitalea sp. MJ-SS2]MDU8927545.1 FAD-binding oxidoreductase [Alisedimentitalea sp. MJ-SS2]